MSTPGYLSNSELAAKVSGVVDRWNTRENQMIALISQPNGTVFVTDGLGNTHELPSFPQLQLNVTALTDDLTGAVAQVTDISSTMTGLATAAQASASTAQSAAAEASTAKDAAQAVQASVASSAGQATAAASSAADSAAQAAAAHNDAQTAATDASASASAASASAAAASTARTGAESARDAAQDYAEQAQGIVANAGGVTTVAGRSGAVVLDAADIVSGTFAAARIPKLAISKVAGLDTALAAKLPAGYVPAWAEVTDKPATFPAAPHTHLMEEVAGLQGTLDGKAPVQHTHAVADIPGLQAALTTKRASRYFFNQL